VSESEGRGGVWPSAAWQEQRGANEMSKSKRVKATRKGGFFVLEFNFFSMRKKS
jgi:hypothetical protein